MLYDIARRAADLLSKRRKDESDYFASTVTYGDAASSRWGRNKQDAAACMARAQQTVLMCAERNSRVCAQQRLALYVPARSGGKRRSWAKAIDRKARDRMGKSVRYAEAAGDVEEVLSHHVLDLLNRPNEFMSGTYFFQTLFMSTELTGNRYTHVVQPGAVGVESLWPMMPQYTWVRFCRESLICGYGYGKDGAIEDEFDRDEVIHGKLAPNPRNPFYGIGPVHAIFAEADIESAAIENEGAMWRNGARPDWVLMVPPEVDPKTIPALQSKVNAEHRGPRNRGKFIALQSADIKPLQFTPREMEYIAGKKDVRQSIWAAFGIPESEVTLNDSNLASSRTGSIQYLRQTIKPRIDGLADELTAMLLPKFGIEPGEMWFAYDNPVPSDADGAAVRLVSLVGSRILTPNEARAELNYEPMKGGDTFPEPVSMFGTVAAGHNNDDDQSGQLPGADAKPEEADDMAEKSLRVKKDDEYAPNITQRQVNSIDKMAQAVQEVLFQQPVDVRGDVVVMPGLDAKLAEAIRPYAREFLNRGVEWGVQQMRQAGMDQAVMVEPVRSLEFLNSYTIQLSRGITQTVQADLKATIASGVTEGESLAQMNARVAGALQESSGWRAERIARTENIRMYNEGSRLAYRENGIDKMRFVLSDDACPECKAHAERYAGPQPVTTQEMVPPVHPQCRCAIAPVVDLGEGA